MKAAQVRKALEARHPEDQGEWVVLHEWERIDTFAVRCYTSGVGPIRIAYEIKVSMSDFRSELRKPRKREYACRVAHHYVFAMPWLLAQKVKHEIPEGLGLVGVLEREHGLDTRQIIKPQRLRRVGHIPREPDVLTAAEISGLIRHRAVPPALRWAEHERFNRNQEISRLRNRNEDLRRAIIELVTPQVHVGVHLAPGFGNRRLEVVEVTPADRGGRVRVQVRALNDPFDDGEPRGEDLGELLALGYRVVQPSPLEDADFTLVEVEAEEVFTPA